jgi:hypothetical protein
MDALSGWAIHRKRVVRTNPGELSHTAAPTAAAGADRHPAFQRRVTPTGCEQRALPPARR